MPRATEHNARTRSNGEVFSTKHNDRKFNTDNSPHIDGNLSINNEYSFCESGAETQDENERRFYTKHFTPHLEATNERYLSQRHPDKVKTMDQYRGSKQTCPEETLYQLGTAEEKDVTAKELLEIVKEHLAWIEKTYPQVRILGYTMHLDEPDAAPHVHVRRVWIAHDKDGNEIVSQTKAFEEMGVKAPKEGEEIGRYNNPKVTFTLACRDHYEALCRKRGIVLPEERKEASEVGLEFKDHKRKVIEKKIKDLTEQNEKLTVQNDKLAAHITELAEDKKKLSEENKALRSEKERTEAKLQHALDIINKGKLAILPNTKKNVRGVVRTIDDLNNREKDIAGKEKEMEEDKKSIREDAKKLKEMSRSFSLEKFVERIAEYLEQIFIAFASDRYRSLRQFLKEKHQDRLLKEYDEKEVMKTIRNTNIDPKKEIDEAAKEAEEIAKKYETYDLDRDER
ncbi:MAG: plasmid recombination protein [Clostridia bacterium]|nr:plasmid recombination protein [Clostridia bacterium]